MGLAEAKEDAFGSTSDGGWQAGTATATVSRCGVGAGGKVDIAAVGRCRLGAVGELRTCFSYTPTRRLTPLRRCPPPRIPLINALLPSCRPQLRSAPASPVMASAPTPAPTVAAHCAALTQGRTVSSSPLPTSRTLPPLYLQVCAPASPIPTLAHEIPPPQPRAHCWRGTCELLSAIHAKAAPSLHHPLPSPSAPPPLHPLLFRPPPPLPPPAPPLANTNLWLTDFALLQHRLPHPFHIPLCCLPFPTLLSPLPPPPPTHTPNPPLLLPSSSAPASPAPTDAPLTPTPTTRARCSPPQRLQAKVSEAAGCAVAVFFLKGEWGELQVRGTKEVGRLRVTGRSLVWLQAQLAGAVECSVAAGPIWARLDPSGRGWTHLREAGPIWARLDPSARGWTHLREAGPICARLDCSVPLKVGCAEGGGALTYVTPLTIFGMRLQSLETLVVINCSTLDELPDDFGALTALKSLCVADCRSVVLPDDVGQLTNLHTLFLKSCTEPRLLPPSVTQLASLARLELHECDLAELPEAMGGLTRLRKLYLLSCPRIQQLPESVAALLRLEALVVDECSSLFSVPTSLINLTRLKQLDLTGCALVRRAPECLPGSLETLRLGSYQQVTHLPGTYALPRLNTVSFSNVIFPTDLSRSSLSSLEHLKLMLACEGEFPFPLADLPRLRTLTLISTGVVSLPEFSSCTLQELRQLEILLPELTEIPATIGALRKLTYLEIKAPKMPSLPDSIGALSRLGKLILSNSPALTHLPASLTQLARLRELRVRKAAITSLPANFAWLSRLQVLDLEGCKQLEALPEDVGQLKLLDRLISEGCDRLCDREGRLRVAGARSLYRWF
ncbi:unnamed protein product [Closterium sp. Naga37s-1]|nr:unnamed protein product [Closterium sp. Naga37s-1]